MREKLYGSQVVEERAANGEIASKRKSLLQTIHWYEAKT